MAVNIRAMKTEDWSAVASIYGQGIATNMATFQNCIPSYEQWDQNHLPVGRLVVSMDDQIVGWVALSPVSGQAVFVGVAEVSIYLDEGFRGQGLGRQLMLAALKASEEAGLWCIESWVFEDNTASLKLHESCGFRVVGLREKIGYDEKIKRWRNVILLERRSKILGVE